MTRPIGIDLFAGAGGMSLGFEQAGVDVVAAVEIDPIHAAVHKFNFPRCKVLARSVTNLTGAEIRSLSGIGSRTVDVVFGGAPCQGFSMIGKRALDDPRNSLVADFVRIVDELDARTFVFENVKGLTVGKHRKFLNELIEAFEACGYFVRREWQVLNAADYGVPQDRKRFILLGAKIKDELPEYPLPKTRRPDEEIAGRSSCPTCSEALSDLPNAEDFQALLKSDEIEIGDWQTKSTYAREMRCSGKGAWHYGVPREWNPSVLTSSLRTEHTDVSRRRFSETAPGKVEPISRFFKLAPGGIANTLRAGTDAARGAFTSPRPIHYQYSRCVTVREMARLHGFPDWFRFHETKWHGARQIGNAVPPPLARAIGSKVMSALRFSPKPQSKPIALGDPSLLRMDMSRAATYWGIDKPIGRRDKKSGARKRTQQEIEATR